MNVTLPVIDKPIPIPLILYMILFEIPNIGESRIIILHEYTRIQIQSEWENLYGSKKRKYLTFIHDQLQKLGKENLFPYKLLKYNHM
jgi:hypothetical protein